MRRRLRLWRVQGNEIKFSEYIYTHDIARILECLMTPDSIEWFRQAQYDIGTADTLVTAGRYPPALFYCHLAQKKALKALWVEKFDEVPEKTHSLVFLIELLELNLPDHLVDPLLMINRLGISGRYPHNLEEMLEQYTKGKTLKILNETKEILQWLTQRSSKS
jgi:HEPN domain-containing protein